MNKQIKPEYFKISSGLKNIIGRELITDEYVAVFELVKNAFDANATYAKITISRDDIGKQQIIISDDGWGMSIKDLIKKWLFVAYSEKNKKNNASNYRHNIRRQYAGAKGVGRFSCDRLGSQLIIQTKKKNETKIHSLTINWDDFEADESKEFGSIPAWLDEHPLNSELQKQNSGTVLIISSLRENWDVPRARHLKQALTKLVNPDAEDQSDPFKIVLIDQEAEEADQKAAQKQEKGWQRNIVNGIIRNDIFERINEGTSKISVIISPDGKTIVTTLSNQNQPVFSVKERNTRFVKLHDISIQLYYLDRGAKIRFHKQQGLPTKDYGSVFVYKNGFRINGYGEPGEDFFHIDVRKAQGWKRFLGTRDILGKIAIKGKNDDFIETSSRDHGFIGNSTVDALASFFTEKVLKVLERYLKYMFYWGIPISKRETEKIPQTEELKQQLIADYGKAWDPKDVSDINLNPVAFIASENHNDNLQDTLNSISNIAASQNDEELSRLTKKLNRGTNDIISDNELLSSKNDETQAALEHSQTENQARKKQTDFLKSLTNQSVENLIDGMHSIFTNTEIVRNYLMKINRLLAHQGDGTSKKLDKYFAIIVNANDKANKFAELAIKGNKNLLPSESGDIQSFIHEYMTSSTSDSGITYESSRNDKKMLCHFEPANICIIIDNIVSNSFKAHADHLTITFSETSNKVIIDFLDNGIGLDPALSVKDIFDYGLTKNQSAHGFGIGLYQIKKLANEMNGDVSIITDYKKGFGLRLELIK
ncbi:ATP-binding protein [Bifidobacterium sp. ESL0728]|uniref:ATP-binding protein n=1 Tax=Bifidobacterium sp. ESL0728 TaxID=2983220 RepID=UPI0023F8C577|nr:ATP-binding protein [Bifidobacterium sp. ESL0728]WEV59542.1 ATP-binding protein [Bifidobacterium sp. ESL0728]